MELGNGYPQPADSQLGVLTISEELALDAAEAQDEQRRRDEKLEELVEQMLGDRRHALRCEFIESGKAAWLESSIQFEYQFQMFLVSKIIEAEAK